MLPDLTLRLIWTVLLGGFFILLFFSLNRLLVRQAGNRRLGLETARPGTPAILYFTTPECAPCRTVQRPALRSLIERAGDSLQIIEVNAAANPDIANHWKVLSVPTTWVIDSSGVPRHVNHGVASADKLWQQLKEI